jgi:Histidine kinase-, DNA gyrase B-, and HSP90-like ATPase
VDGVAARTGLRIHLDSAIDGRLPPAVETALYRIMQEGLTNVTKHAGATHVQLQLRRDARTVHALLQDDGVGFAVDPVVNQRGARGLGLLGIQERVEVLGGTLQLTSAPGQGTTLQISLPVDPEEASSEANRTWADSSLPASTDLGGTGSSLARDRLPAPPDQEFPHVSSGIDLMVVPERVRYPSGQGEVNHGSHYPDSG